MLGAFLAKADEAGGELIDLFYTVEEGGSESTRLLGIALFRTLLLGQTYPGAVKLLLHLGNFVRLEIGR